MRWTDVAEDWPAYVEALHTRWPETDLTELEAIDGNRDRLEAYVAEVNGIPKEDARDEVTDWLRGPTPADARMDETRDNQNIVNSARYVAPGEDVYSDDRDFGDDGLADRPIGRES